MPTEIQRIMMRFVHERGWWTKTGWSDPKYPLSPRVSLEEAYWTEIARYPHVTRKKQWGSLHKCPDKEG